MYYFLQRTNKSIYLERLKYGQKGHSILRSRDNNSIILPMLKCSNMDLVNLFSTLDTDVRNVGVDLTWEDTSFVLTNAFGIVSSNKEYKPASRLVYDFAIDYDTNSSEVTLNFTYKYSVWKVTGEELVSNYYHDIYTATPQEYAKMMILAGAYDEETARTVIQNAGL